MSRRRRITVLRFWVAQLALLLVIHASGTIGQAQRQTYGEEGRLFSASETDKSTDVYYLLERTWAPGEDRRGFIGRLRIVRTYKVGGYEILFREFYVTCYDAGGPLSAQLTEPGGDGGNNVGAEVGDSEGAPSNGDKPLVNLYWATCRNAFEKFK